MLKDSVKIAVLVSGGGTNLQALIDAQNSGILNSGKISLVISNNPNAYAIERAVKAGIDYAVVCKKDCASQEEFEQNIIDLIEANGIELIVLAGFMSILGENFTKKYDKPSVREELREIKESRKKGDEPKRKDPEKSSKKKDKKSPEHKRPKKKKSKNKGR